MDSVRDSNTFSILMSWLRYRMSACPNPNNIAGDGSTAHLLQTKRTSRSSGESSGMLYVLMILEALIAAVVGGRKTRSWSMSDQARLSHINATYLGHVGIHWVEDSTADTAHASLQASSSTFLPLIV